MPEISNGTKKLIEYYRSWRKLQDSNPETPKIHVDEVASKVAAFYEKIRTIVDWKEEHLMRRAAITRKLKRRFMEGKIESMAEPLVLELIRGGHFANDKIEETKIAEVQAVLNKYNFILKESENGRNKGPKLDFLTWILEIAACEIEETLCPPIRENALINYMFSEMKKKIKLEDRYRQANLDEASINIQIYIAVQQALFKLDSPIISYNLLKYKHPLWKSPPEDWLLEASRNISKIKAGIEKDIKNPFGKKFYAICEKYDTPYLLLGDILSDEKLEENIQRLSDPESLEGMITKAYKKRYSTLKSRFYRAAIYSTLSIFLTHILTFLVLEIPLAELISGKFSSSAALVDILVPTALMLLFAITIKMPSKNNLKLAIIETIKIAYEKEKTDLYEIKIRRKRGIFMKAIISGIYVFGAIVSFGLIFLGCELAELPPTSVIVNIIFIALIVFAGITIKARNQELTIEEKKPGLFGFIFDIFFLPVAAAGRWLSQKWKKYNAIAAFFNALIDMPFSTFVEFIEQWRYFLKDKKEEIH